MKKILLAAFVPALFFLTGCHHSESATTSTEKTDSGYAIIGKVTGLDSGWIYILHAQTGKSDSAALDHGYFKFSGRADTAEFCRLSLNDHTKSFFLENGKIAMLVKKDSIRNALISGTPTQDAFSYFQEHISKPITEQMAQTEKNYDLASEKKNQRKMDNLDKVFTALDLEKKQLVMDYCNKHPASLISPFLIFENFSYNSRLGQVDSLYALLDPSVQRTYYGRQVLNMIDKLKLTAIGNPAPAFSSADPDGKLIPVSSFKGKYVLIDFWASWCGPCRQENPNIVKAYHQFHDKGFEIFGVSLDDTRDDWLKAIKKDGLSWTQVSDLKGWQNEAAAIYGVKAIPMNYLLDQKGIIVARGLRGDELAAKLSELLH